MKPFFMCRWYIINAILAVKSKLKLCNTSCNMLDLQKLNFQL